MIALQTEYAKLHAECAKMKEAEFRETLQNARQIGDLPDFASLARSRFGASHIAGIGIKYAAARHHASRVMSSQQQRKC
jgi:hypothetical protein